MDFLTVYKILSRGVVCVSEPLVPRLIIALPTTSAPERNRFKTQALALGFSTIELFLFKQKVHSR